jgi:hypothetical protein
MPTAEHLAFQHPIVFEIGVNEVADFRYERRLAEGIASIRTATMAVQKATPCKTLAAQLGISPNFVVTERPPG